MFQYWLEKPGAYILRLVANQTYPFFTEKKRIEEQKKRWRDPHDDDYVLIGYTFLTYNEIDGIMLSKYFIYKDFPDEWLSLRGKGLEMLCHVLTIMKQDNPEINDSTKVNLEASGGESRIDPVKFIHNKYPTLTTLDEESKLNFMMEIIKSRSDEKNFNYAIGDLNLLKTIDEKVMYAYEQLSGIFENDKLVKYYERLSFKVKYRGDPMGVEMETTFGQLYEKCS
jgi:hypothetical protein